MGTLFSALHIGRAGMQVAQIQLDVAGNNIANVNKEGYSRQRANLTTRTPIHINYGAIGRGPAVKSIERLREEYFDKVYRKQLPELGSTRSQSNFFNRLEDIFQEPSDQGFARRLSLFFDALNSFATQSEDLSVRESLLSESAAVAGSLNETARRLRLLRTNANEEVRALVPEINSLAERIAAANLAVSRIEVGGVKANDLRDDRDLLLDQLANLVSITYSERENGELEVLLGGNALVSGRSWRALEAVADPGLDDKRDDLLRVQWVESKAEAVLLGGEIYGALRMRDVTLHRLEDRLDTLAIGLMNAVNGIHSQGRGLSIFNSSLDSVFERSDPTAPLNTVDPIARIPYEVTDGSFDIMVYDNAGNQLGTETIAINAATTSLNDIQAAIDASPWLAAGIDGSGRLTITPAAGVSFRFANDTANALPALGLNLLFAGVDAYTINLSSHLFARPDLLSSGYNADLGNTGDNTAALEMAALRQALLFDDNRATADQYFQTMLVRIGIESRVNRDTLDIEQAFIQDFERRREEVSGVNLDEEVASLIQFQRAYEGAARIISVADRMLETLLNMV